MNLLLGGRLFIKSPLFLRFLCIAFLVFTLETFHATKLLRNVLEIGVQIQQKPH